MDIPPLSEKMDTLSVVLGVVMFHPRCSRLARPPALAFAATRDRGRDRGRRGRGSSGATLQCHVLWPEHRAVGGFPVAHARGGTAVRLAIEWKNGAIRGTERSWRKNRALPCVG